MLKYKVEIIAESMEELAQKLKETADTLQKDKRFCDKVESKGMESMFFTNHANVLVVDTGKEDTDEE